METTIPSPSSKFKQISSDFNTFKAHALSELKHKIIMDLNDLMLLRNLKDEEREEAIGIAKDIDAQNLKVRLDVYHQSGSVDNSKNLPSKLMPLIIWKFLEEASITDINTLLHTSKDFNLNLLSMPIILNMSTQKLSERVKVTDKVLAKIVELFPKMRTLDLAECKNITNAGLVDLMVLTQLNKLNLYGCDDITGAGLKRLTSLAQLTYLNLGRIRNAQVWLKRLTTLTQLKYLNLQATNIADEELKLLRSFPQLTDLNVRGCINIRYAGSLQDYTQLTCLNLSFCDTIILDEVMWTLTSLTQLRYLNVNASNRLRNVEIMGLKNALPNLHIET